MSHHRRAFTLIELLVVITIIALLASLTVTMVSVVKFNAKKLVTGERLNSITAGLSQLGQQEGSAPYVLQKNVLSLDPWTPYTGTPMAAPFPRYEGVVAFDTTGTFNTIFGATAVFDAFPGASSRKSINVLVPSARRIVIKPPPPIAPANG